MDAWNNYVYPAGSVPTEAAPAPAVTPQAQITPEANQDFFEGAAQYSRNTAPEADGSIYHVINVDLSQAQIVIGLPSGVTRRTSTSNFLAESGAQIAVNGDGWTFKTDPETGQKYLVTGGPVASAGKAWTSKQTGNEQTLYIDENNHFSLEPPANGPDACA